MHNLPDCSSAKVGAVRPLFTFQPTQVDYPYDITADGQRVLVAARVDAPGTESMQVIVNWSPGPAR